MFLPRPRSLAPFLRPTALALALGTFAHTAAAVSEPDLRIGAVTQVEDSAHGGFDGPQGIPAVAQTANGNYVIAWVERERFAGLTDSIYVRRYSPFGPLDAAPIQVMNGLPIDCDVAMDASGNFIVAWTDEQNGTRFKRYDAAGNVLGPEAGTRAGYHSGRKQQFNRPAIGMDADGDFVLAWEYLHYEGQSARMDVQARRYRKDGTALDANPIAVGGALNVSPDYSTIDVAIEAGPLTSPSILGDFAVTWLGTDATAGGGLLVRRFAGLTGAPIGSAIKADTAAAGGGIPSIAMSAAGDIRLAWISQGATDKIFMRRFTDTGAAAGDPIQIATRTSISTTEAYPAAIATDAVGDFVVGWIDGANTFVRGFYTTGTPIFDATKIDTVAVAAPGMAVAMDADGDFAALTRHKGASTNGYYMRRSQYRSHLWRDLSLTIAGEPAQVIPGGDVTYTMSLRNNAPAQAPTGWPAIDSAYNLAHPGRVYVHPDTLAGSAADYVGNLSEADWTCNSSLSLVTCATSRLLAPGETAPSLQLKFRAPAGDAALGTTIQMNADTLLENLDHNLPNNHDVEPTAIACGASTVSFVSTKQQVDENLAGGFAQFVVERTGDLACPVSVRVDVDSTGVPSPAATADVDYSAAPKQLDWAAGEGGTRTVGVAIGDDAASEPDEYLGARLTSLSASHLTVSGPATLLILDDERPMPTVKFGMSKAHGGERVGLVQLPVQLSEAQPARDVIVPVRYKGTATRGTDWTGPDFVTIPKGNTAVMLFIVVKNDTAVEGPEKIVVTMGEPSNATAAAPTQFVYTIRDNDQTPAGE